MAVVVSAKVGMAAVDSSVLARTGYGEHCDGDASNNLKRGRTINARCLLPVSTWPNLVSFFQRAIILQTSSLLVAQNVYFFAKLIQVRECVVRARITDNEK